MQLHFTLRHKITQYFNLFVSVHKLPYHLCLIPFYNPGMVGLVVESHVERLHWAVRGVMMQSGWVLFLFLIFVSSSVRKPPNDFTRLPVIASEIWLQPRQLVLRHMDVYLNANKFIESLVSL